MHVGDARQAKPHLDTTLYPFLEPVMQPLCEN